MMNTSQSNQRWTEDDSRLYREIARAAVPAQEDQIASMLTLIPFSKRESFRVVEIGCGEGLLTCALLECFPLAKIVALDGSVTMRDTASARLRRFRERVKIAPFELNSDDWLHHLDDSDCIVTSLCLHHLDQKGKQKLFAETANRISPKGAFLVADLIEPQKIAARNLFAETWDRYAEEQSRRETDSNKLYKKFVKEKWNYYRYPDPVDRPSPLFDQLQWLKQAGFEVVDCFWLQAGHAIYGGYKSKIESRDATISYKDAQQLVPRFCTKLAETATGAALRAVCFNIW